MHCDIFLQCPVDNFELHHNGSERLPRILKAGIDLPIVARPTLDSREVLTRIAQKETRRVMVFERERERRRDI